MDAVSVAQHHALQYTDECHAVKLDVLSRWSMLMPPFSTLQVAISHAVVCLGLWIQ
jgi:hypothetical protein